MPLEPLICRSRYRNVKKSYKNKRKFGKSKKQCIFAVSKKNKSINRSTWNNKNKMIMKTIAFIVEFREKVSNKRDCFIVTETTINKAFKEAEKICKIKNAKMIGIREA